jgi:UDP-N-acetylglucosamine 2-epimerase
MLANFEENTHYADKIFTSSEKTTRKILVLFGTRPEAIKLAPVIYALKKHSAFQTIVASSSQHTDLLAPFFTDFQSRNQLRFARDDRKSNAYRSLRENLVVARRDFRERKA